MLPRAANGSVVRPLAHRDHRFEYRVLKIFRRWAEIWTKMIEFVRARHRDV
jgi:hypothetical protein